MPDVARAMHRTLAACILCAPTALAAPHAAASEEPWSYRVGETRAAQQGNFCQRREQALEIADIFRRYGAPTGFSALSNAPGCALAMHDATPLALIDSVRVELDGGEHYTVRFIHVEVDGGASAVLITTRALSAAD